MAIRDSIATTAMSWSRSFGRLIGCELVVEVSDHSIETSMEVPNQDERAWDSNLYKHGQLYYQGYANPIKPEVNANVGLESKDTIDCEVSEVRVEGGEDATDSVEELDGNFALIASQRYQQFMQQDLISQLLNPKERWRILAYGIIGTAILNSLTLMAALSAAGVI